MKIVCVHDSLPDTSPKNKKASPGSGEAARVMTAWFVSVRAELYRPARAERMMVPVMVPHEQHCCTAYRPAAPAVKRLGTEAFASGVRLSAAP